MAEESVGFMDVLKGIGEAINTAVPGLSSFGEELGAEMSRLATQGSMEMASALFRGDAFVPYGPGQYTPSNDGPEISAPEMPEMDQQLERGGRGM